jgi:hypothetical protein
VKLFFIDWSQRGKLFTFALPLMGSFFYWLYAVGYKLFTSQQKGGREGNEDKEFA